MPYTVRVDRNGKTEKKDRYYTPGRKKKSELELSTDELIEKYGKRYAYEWFVRLQDNNNLKMSKEYTDSKNKRITALAVTNAVITVLLLILVIWKILQ